jgi:hypothetical protein
VCLRDAVYDMYRTSGLFASICPTVVVQVIRILCDELGRLVFTRYTAGIDMTPEQLAVANKYVEEYTRDVLRYSKPNMRFLQVVSHCALFVVHTAVRMALKLVSKSLGCGPICRCIGFLKGAVIEECKLLERVRYRERFTTYSGP